jgi:hypothetical protein
MVNETKCEARKMEKIFVSGKESTGKNGKFNGKGNIVISLRQLNYMVALIQEMQKLPQAEANASRLSSKNAQCFIFDKSLSSARVAGQEDFYALNSEGLDEDYKEVV